MGFFDRFLGPPTEDQFAKTLADALSRAGDDRQLTYDKAEFRLLCTKDGEDAGMVNLRNLFAEYCATPRKERSAWLSRTCGGLVNHMEIPDDFEDAKPDLLPSVRPRSMIDVMRLGTEITGSKWLDLATLPLSENLVVCLVYDLPTTMSFVTEETLGKWGVSLYEAAEVAKQNLEQRDGSYASIGGKLFTFVSGDAFDATRMLMLDRVRSLELTGDPVALPVTRDSLLIAGSDDDEGLAMMAGMADSQKENPRPICPIPHRLVGVEWQPWRPPASNPNHELFRILELRYWYGEYDEQKKLLEKRHEQTGEDVFVASYTAGDRGGKMTSYVVWSEIPTWLPMADYVGFFSKTEELFGFVRWDRVQDNLGHLMKYVDCYPPRWFVDEFPSKDQIVQMRPESWKK